MSIPINEILLDEFYTFNEHWQREQNHMTFTKDNVALIYEFHLFFKFPIWRAGFTDPNPCAVHDPFLFVQLFIMDAIKNDWLEFAMETMMKYVELREDIHYQLEQRILDGLHNFYYKNLTPKQNVICQKYFDVAKIAEDLLKRCENGKENVGNYDTTIKEKIERCNEILEALKESTN